MELLNKNKLSEQVKLRSIAFAAVCNAVSLANQLALTGVVKEDEFAAMINSLFSINSNSIEDIYPNLISIKPGIEKALSILDGSIVKDKAIARYVFSILHLERKLMNNTDMQDSIRQGIRNCERQLNHFNDKLHPSIIANIAGIYSDTISNFKFRVHIVGKPEYLNQPFVMNKIRTCLLAGIRAAILWQQLGGRRWQLLFTKQYYINALKSLSI